MTPPAVLAIDAGGTAVKVVAFDLDGAEIARAIADVRTHHHPDGRVERDPEAFWTGIAGALRGVTTALGGRRVLAVGCTGFGNGVFLVDAAGRGTRPGIVSVDHRAQPLVDELVASGAAAGITSVIGCRLWGGQTLLQLAQLNRVEPEVMAATRWALSCKDFIRFRLTGTALTDPTDASGGGLMDLATGTYAEAVFEQLCMAPVLAKLPPLADNSAVAGVISATAAAETGLVAGTPVAGSMMDVAACALGAGATGDDVMTMIAGTWSINALETPRNFSGSAPLLSVLHRDRACLLIAEGSPSSAANLGWYLEKALQARISVDEASARVTATAVEGQRCQFLPFVFGPAPRRGAFIDLGASDDEGTLLRAIFEGVAFQHRLHAEAAAGLAGRTLPDRIRLAGGAARSAVWAQIFADVCQRPVEVVRAAEVGALGVAICAAVAGGGFADLSTATRAMTGTLSAHTPNAAHAAFYTARFQEFRRLDQGMVALLAGRPS